MRISTLVLAAALLAPLTSAAAQGSSSANDQVIQRERDMWEYVKSHNLAPLRSALDPNLYTSVTQHGVHGLPTDTGRLEWTSLDSYELSDFETKSLDSQTVVLTYRAQLRGRTLGNRVAGVYWMATIWRQTNGAWLAIFHSEVKGS